MLNLFKILDLPRLILLILLLVGFLVIGGSFSFPQTSMELYNYVVSQHIGSGNVMYKELFHWTAPLTSFLNYINYLLWDNSILSYRIVALLIIIFQAALLTQLFNNKDVFLHRNGYPAVLYVLFSVLSPDMLSLNGALYANTFVIFLLYTIIVYMKDNNKVFAHFGVGIFSSLSFLFYSPYIFTLPLSILVLAMYSPFNLRKLITIIYAFLIPNMLVGIYFYWKDSLSFYFDFFVFETFSFQKIIFVPTSSFVVMAAIFILLNLLLFFFLVTKSTSLENIQFRIIISTYLFLTFSILNFTIIKEQSMFTFWQLAPFMAIILTYYFDVKKRSWSGEIFLWMVIAGFFGLRAYTTNHIKTDVYYSVLPQKFDFDKKYENAKTILVLGDEIGAYQNKRLATPFLNWNLSKPYFDHMDQYESVTLLDKYLSSKLPHLIVDKKNNLSKVFNRLPNVSKQYSWREEGVYELKSLSISN